MIYICLGSFLFYSALFYHSLFSDLIFYSVSCIKRDVLLLFFIILWFLIQGCI
jgi:hypothetical protein